MIDLRGKYRMIYSVFIVQVLITAGANIVLYNEGLETHVTKYVERLLRAVLDSMCTILYTHQISKPVQEIKIKKF